MIKIFNTNLNKLVDIKTTCIIDYKLYIVYFVNNKFIDNLKDILLITINLITREIVDKKLKTIDMGFYSDLYIKNDGIYIIYGSYELKYNMNCEILYENSIHNIYTSFDNYCLIVDYKYYYDDYYLIENKYVHLGEYNDNIILTLSFVNNPNKHDFKINIYQNKILINSDFRSIEILYFNDYIILNKSTLFVYNIKFGNIIKLKYKCKSIGNGKFLYNINQHNNLPEEYYVFDLSKNVNLPIDEKKIIINKYYKSKHYLNNINDFSYRNYKLDNNLKDKTNLKLINVYYNFKFDNNNDNYYLIFDYKNYDLVLYLNEENLNNELTNLNIDERINILSKLLTQKNQNIIPEIIAEKIYYYDTDINEAFEYFNVIILKETCSSDFKLKNLKDYIKEKIFYTILCKYDFDDIINKIYNMDKNTNLYNYCINEFIKYTINDIKI